jgi:8-oxo-dGTP pyrophosphatase MutT (NUDIX family)
MSEKQKLLNKLKQKPNLEKVIDMLEIGNINKFVKKEEKYKEYANFILINLKNEILCLKRTINQSDEFSGLWCLPGGHIDINEQPQQAAIRELLEETNIDLKYQQATINLFDIVDVDNKSLFYYIYKIIPEENKELDILLILKENEHSNWMWFPKDEIDKCNKFIGNLKDTLLKVLK